MLALPIRFGGLGIFNPCKPAHENYQFSVSITSPLTSANINQLSSFGCSILQQQRTLKPVALSIKHKNLSNSFSSLHSTLYTGL